MTPPHSELSRPVRADRIGAEPLPVKVEASPAECRAVAARLGLPSVAALSCRFRLQRRDATRIAATGELAATVTQVCVVSLDPFETGISERFEVAFVPAGQEADDDPESVDDLPYADGTIDLGEAAVEQLALALDPYPRKPGAALPAAAADEPANPFAVLGRRQ